MFPILFVLALPTVTSGVRKSCDKLFLSSDLIAASREDVRAGGTGNFLHFDLFLLLEELNEVSEKNKDKLHRYAARAAEITGQAQPAGRITRLSFTETEKSQWDAEFIRLVFKAMQLDQILRAQGQVR